MANTLINAKRLAYECQREVLRRRVRPAVRLDRDARRRARRLMTEMVMYWKRNEKYERERRRRAEREMEERRRREEEEREAKRQQRKFNYLITQTELYAHFMRNKQGGTFVRRENAARRLHRVSRLWPLSFTHSALHPTPDGTKASKSDTHGAESILGKLDETPEPGDEGADSARLKQRALEQAQSAVAAARERTSKFDARRRDKAAAAGGVSWIQMELNRTAALLLALLNLHPCSFFKQWEDGSLQHSRPVSVLFSFFPGAGSLAHVTARV
jgi:DNA helicase INO80